MPLLVPVKLRLIPAQEPGAPQSVGGLEARCVNIANQGVCSLNRRELDHLGTVTILAYMHALCKSGSNGVLSERERKSTPWVEGSQINGQTIGRSETTLTEK